MPPYYLLDHRANDPVWHPTRLKPIRLIVIHTAEQGADWDDWDDGGAESLAKYGANTTRQVSWHQSLDSDSIIPMLPDEYTAWHVRGFNSESLGVEIATYANRWPNAPADWTGKVLDNLALLVGRWCDDHDIPRSLITRDDVDAGAKGIVSHAMLDPTRRTDPGASFPWDGLMGRLLGLHPAPAPAPASTSAGNDWVTSWQVILKDLGFDPGIVDGKPGPNTDRALKELVSEHDSMYADLRAIRAILLQ